MPTQPTRAERINAGDRVRIHPANGADPYGAELTDLGAWGVTARIGTRLVFLPWSAVDLVERASPKRPTRGDAPDAPPAWCPATVHDGTALERCDLTIGHEGAHVGERSGKPFGSLATVAR